jgi:fermentation-respiration switch protein FrsA (DUF1100 family)
LQFIGVHGSPGLPGSRRQLVDGQIALETVLDRPGVGAAQTQKVRLGQHQSGGLQAQVKNQVAVFTTINTFFI